MKITTEMVQEAIDTFVNKYNQEQVPEACELYSPFAILIDKGQPVMGRTSIVEYLTKDHSEGSITNHHVDMVNISCDGQNAMAFIQFTVGHKTKERGEDCYLFPQSCSSMLFELNEGKLCATSSMSLTQREC